MRIVLLPSIKWIVPLFAVAGGLGIAHAADVYRWVDEQGVVHLSDRVPPAHRQSAVRVTPDVPSVSEADRSQAQARARAEQARASEAQARADRAASAAQRDNRGVVASMSPPPMADMDMADCESRTRAYLESVDCFAPYVNANGTTRAEAYVRCRAVPAPPARCARVADGIIIGYPERPRHRFGRNTPVPAGSSNDPSRGTCAVGQSPPVGSITCPPPRRSQ